jgi:hypothetical protein
MTVPQEIACSASISGTHVLSSTSVNVGWRTLKLTIEQYLAKQIN